MDESGGWKRGGGKKETKKQWKRTRAIFSAASRLIFPPLCVRACVRAWARHGPMTSIHFHARMENSGGMETVEGNRGERYFSRPGVQESSLRASFKMRILKKKREGGHIKNELNVERQRCCLALAFPFLSALFRGMSFITSRDGFNFARK